MRSSVAMVILLPSRNLCTNLPSLTARRPKVDSAMSAWRQNCEIWLRISSFFIGAGVLASFGTAVGSAVQAGSPTTICPTGETDGKGGSRRSRSRPPLGDRVFQTPDLLELAFQRDQTNRIKGKSGEDTDPPAQQPIGFLVRQWEPGRRSHCRGRVRNTPMRHYRLPGPGGTDFHRRIVANRKTKIEHRPARADEFGP